MRNVQTFNYQNYCMDSNQILHTSKHHETCFVDGPEMQKTNQCWWTAAILKQNRKIIISLQLLDWFPWNLAQWCIWDLRNSSAINI